MAAATAIQAPEQPGQVTQASDLDGGHIVDFEVVYLKFEVNDFALHCGKFGFKNSCRQLFQDDSAYEVLCFGPFMNNLHKSLLVSKLVH